MFESVIHNENGIIAWRRGTGDNVELTYLLTKGKRDGEGTRLFARMIDMLRHNPPYYSIYGFCRAENKVAIAFYESLGFIVEKAPPIYKQGGTRIFMAPWEKLCA